MAISGEDTPSWRAFVAATAFTPEGEPTELRNARGSHPEQPDEVVVTFLGAAAE